MEDNKEIEINLEGSITDSKEKIALISKSVETAGYALGYAFIMCGLQTHIETTIVMEGRRFKLSFKKEDEQG